jgi:hypothetical protein
MSACGTYTVPPVPPDAKGVLLSTLVVPNEHTVSFLRTNVFNSLQYMNVLETVRPVSFDKSTIANLPHSLKPPLRLVTFGKAIFVKEAHCEKALLSIVVTIGKLTSFTPLLKNALSQSLETLGKSIFTNLGHFAKA